MPLDQLLMQQTRIAQELGLYLSDGDYLPTSRDLLLITDLDHRGRDTLMLCRHLEVEYWNRSRANDV